MKTVVALLSLISAVAAFSPGYKSQNVALTTLMMGYVPEGMSPEEYRKLRAKEKDEMSKKRFGAFGPQSFKSRSLKAFQTDLEKGKAAHLMPMLNAKDRLKKGEIKAKDIPYMQRLGSWDDSDIGGKKKWTADDKKYNQSSKPSRLDWMGGNPRRGGPQQQQGEKKPPKKNFFGLF